MAREETSETLHATSVAIDGRAVLLCGPSGVGKSDLALRLIDRGATLVSDDYTLLKWVDGRLEATAPQTITGMMEVRGLGLVDMPCIDYARVALMVDLSDDIDRMPADPEGRMIAGVTIPVVRIAPLEPSAPIKVELALKTMGLA
ncbi:Serine kinase of the HPr protein, regulates carbohydrate metabolism [Sphingobium herbicidovorans NBRC 16415]|jgi:serine kinase of HPr protein (carbohydrate metabolism regulator)|uniref:Serine kinase of the HPr protein, regulates carbohydrate metabolism n=1 Tax=Sphingobium herbicidovorans (strain ATCC 700291 / DSM 11019 / CCUG 56400 / KCTC 2939 / LMG 18315 / NBRC 16415 / MH) TaxID=1219045 RepID=A0A086PEG1_SPHHM|nr:HPr kinase/phosphatase C-terminal domain-containing protein [Sphingobium herbicidovorans]KFG91779.1 Serine kinase of the HPr protein, regulates carbohydrate metabolism [Sphingobium herbicidovorans NBRC 16415]